MDRNDPVPEVMGKMTEKPHEDYFLECSEVFWGNILGFLETAWNFKNTLGFLKRP